MLVRPMYVIGTSPNDLIEIELNTFITNPYNWTMPSKITQKVTHIYYGIQSQLTPTIIFDFDTAKEIIAEIKSNYNNIKFDNSNIVAQVLDKQKGFKFDVSKLKIFELIPTEVKENDYDSSTVN